MKSRNTILMAILSALACFAFLPGGRADDPVSLSNTADGQLALASLTSGIYNSAFGFYALLSNADANFNTGVGEPSKSEPETVVNNHKSCQPTEARLSRAS
jgi:hypothetical protein